MGGLRVAMLTVLLVLGARPGLAQGDRWQRQVAASLVRGGAMLSEQGYRVVARPGEGWLFAEESRQLDFRLALPGEYALLGVCDGDCDALHLVLSNATGYELAAERAAGNVPLVRLSVPAAGGYRVRVTMEIGKSVV